MRDIDFERKSESHTKYSREPIDNNYLWQLLETAIAFFVAVSLREYHGLCSRVFNDVEYCTS